jgi:hypothetical protein
MNLTGPIALLIATAPLAQVGSPLGRVEDITAGLPHGKVWLVPHGGGSPVRHASIQGAVDAAQDGDTVLLGDGVFVGPENRDVLVSGKNVVIRSANGPQACIVDAQLLGRGFHFEGAAVTSATRLEGITVVRGDAGLPMPGSPEEDGGCVFAEGDATPMIEGCVLRYGRAYSGGGIAFRNQSLAKGLVRDCVISDNQAFRGGGLLGEGVRVERCRVERNVAENGGGAFCFERVELADSLFASNQGAMGGGVWGGGCCSTSDETKIFQCTIVSNQAGQMGGGIIAYISSVRVLNSILWGNEAPAGPQAFREAFFVDHFVLSYCDIEGGQAGVGYSSLPPTFSNILDLDPLFADPAAGDYRLSLASPCIEAGDPAFVAARNEGDIEYQPRKNGLVDMGADERWDGFVLSLVDPGRAGQANSIMTSGSAPGSFVHFFSGTTPGSFALGFPLCPDLALDIADPLLLAVQAANAAGEASHVQFVPIALAGQTLVYQAVSLDLSDPRDACEVSNLVSFSYP